MQVARYRCASPDCPERLLLGIRNEAHIGNAYVNIRLQGWKYDGSSGQFFCAVHHGSGEGNDGCDGSSDNHTLGITADRVVMDVVLPIPVRDDLDTDVGDADDNLESVENVADEYVRVTEDYVHVGWRSK